MIVIGSVFLLGTGLFFLKKSKKQPPKEEVTELKNVSGFTSTPGESNADFEEYLCAYAKQRNIKKDSLEEIEYLMAANFESIQLSYVYQTNKALVLNDVRSCIEKAAQKYMES